MQFLTNSDELIASSPLRATAEDTVNYSSAGVKEPPSGLTYLDPFIATVPPGSVHHDHKACDPSGSSDPSDHLYPRPVFLLQAPQLELVMEVAREEPCCKLYRGGDLFDDIKKLRMSWKLIK